MSGNNCGTSSICMCGGEQSLSAGKCAGQSCQDGNGDGSVIGGV